MAERKSFLLRMDPKLWAGLEAWAQDEFRSVNGQIEWILHRALKEAGRVKDRSGADAAGGEKHDGDAGG